MKRTIYTCDHCGKELDPMLDFPNVKMGMNGERIEYDLCVECLNELEDLCRDFLSGNRGKRVIAGEKKDAES